MKLAQHLQDMPARPPSAREILLAMIETADIEVAIDGRITVILAPDERTLDALMCFDAGAREDDQVRDVSADFYGSGCRAAAG